MLAAEGAPARRRDSAHHAQPGRRRRDVRPRGRHVRRQDPGGRAGATSCSRIRCIRTRRGCSDRFRAWTARTRAAAQRRSPARCPSILDLPAGCKFVTRCPHRFEPCADIEPPLIEMAPGPLGPLPSAIHADMTHVADVDSRGPGPDASASRSRRRAAAPRRRGARRGRRVVRARAGRDARAGRRVGLRQDDGRPRHRQHPARDELRRRDHGPDPLSPRVAASSISRR